MADRLMLTSELQPLQAFPSMADPILGGASLSAFGPFGPAPLGRPCLGVLAGLMAAGDPEEEEELDDDDEDDDLDDDEGEEDADEDVDDEDDDEEFDDDDDDADAEEADEEG